MLFKIIEKIKQAFTPISEQDALTQYIERHHPTSVYDVEYWIQQYDRKQYNTAHSSNFGYHCR